MLMKIALGQMNAKTDKAANLTRMAAFAAEAGAAGADLLVFPECAMLLNPDPTAALGPIAEPVDGPFVSALGDLARRHHLAIVSGMYESIPGSEKAHNTSVAIAADGSLIGAYRKIHLFDAFGYRESDKIVPGDGETVVFELAGMKLGLQTCYDVRFPELARHLMDRGVEVIVQPTAWAHGLLKEQHWETLVRARAIENTCYMAACDQTLGTLSGNSMLVDPMGVAIARAGETECLVIGEASPERVRTVRANVPTLLHRRPDVYTGWQPVAR
ncbi:MAG TPA: carbon-nitrogen hydrolase family protein [Bacillota bacterium]|nr:carbon-nitrogen hydrolase family protein [Bacillota bacterium]